MEFIPRNRVKQQIGRGRTGLSQKFFNLVVSLRGDWMVTNGKFLFIIALNQIKTEHGLWKHTKKKNTRLDFVFSNGTMANITHKAQINHKK